MNLGPGGIETDVVRIDSIMWSTPGNDEIIGFLYRLHNGSEWISTRRSVNISDQGLAQFIAFLDAVRVRPNEDWYPVERRDNGYFQYKVKGVARNLSKFDLHLQPCVAWPAGKPLP
jgi:hypothetical protein